MKVVVIGGGDFADGLDRDLDNVDSENEQKKLVNSQKEQKKLWQTWKWTEKLVKSKNDLEKDGLDQRP